MMTRNVGNMDRGARIVLGLALVAGYFATGESAYNWVYLVGAAIALLTGVLGSCGIYSLIAMSTCKRG
jgi:hypothetical protein